MGGDITNEVLAERIEHFRSDQHDDMEDIKRQLAQLVPREVYDAHRIADSARITTLEKKADALDAERKQMLRWLIGAVAIPILVLVAQLYMSAHGVKP